MNFRLIFHTFTISIFSKIVVHPPLILPQLPPFSMAIIVLMLERSMPPGRVASGNEARDGALLRGFGVTLAEQLKFAKIRENFQIFALRRLWRGVSSPKFGNFLFLGVSRRKACEQSGVQQRRWRGKATASHGRRSGRICGARLAGHYGGHFGRTFPLKLAWV